MRERRRERERKRVIELLKPVYSYTIYRKREKVREIKKDRERQIEKEKKGQTSNDEPKRKIS